MASNLEAMASYPRAMASNLEAMASNPRAMAMASNLVSMADLEGLQLGVLSKISGLMHNARMKNEVAREGFCRTAGFWWLSSFNIRRLG